MTQKNNFGDLVFRELIVQNNRSLIYSPFSLRCALYLLLLGADSEAKSQLEAVFKTQDLEALTKTMKQRLASFSEKAIIANSLWLNNNSNKDTTVGKEYLENSKDFAQVSSVDFKNIQTHINGWISNATKNAINNLSSNNLSPNSAMAIVNAVYFKDKWQHEFDPMLTKSDIFYIDAKNKKHIPFMNFRKAQMIEYYKDGAGSSMVCLDYKSNFSMAICLNNNNNTLATSSSLFRKFPNLKKKEVFAIIPKFEHESNFALLDVLVKLGLTGLKDKNFKAINESAYVSQVVQKCKIKIDEFGTVASVATMIAVTGSKSNKKEDTSKPIIFKADRPFSYFIINKKKMDILFEGVFLGK